MTTDTLECGHAPSEHGPHTTGYGVDPETGARSCYECCAAEERERMIETGRAVLYLNGTEPGIDRAVTDWPGRLRFRVRTINRGRHNIAGDRYDVHFVGPDGFWWHGVQYGNNTQIAHCRRTKERAS